MTKVERFLHEVIQGIRNPTMKKVLTTLRVLSFSTDEQVASMAFDALHLVKKLARS